MDAHLTLSARKDEPQPRAHMGGTARDLPILRFGGQLAPACDIHLGQITDLPQWLRRFARALDVLAVQVELVESLRYIVETPVSVPHRAVGEVEL